MDNRRIKMVNGNPPIEIVDGGGLVSKQEPKWEFRYSACPHHNDFTWVNKEMGSLHYRVLVFVAFTPQSWKALEKVQQVQSCKRNPRGIINYVGVLYDKFIYQSSYIRGCTERSNY